MNKISHEAKEKWSELKDAHDKKVVLLYLFFCGVVRLGLI